MTRGIALMVIALVAWPVGARASEIEKLAWMAAMCGPKDATTRDTDRAPRGHDGRHATATQGRTNRASSRLPVRRGLGRVVLLSSPRGAPHAVSSDARPRRVVSENAAHDFPQRIMYWTESGAQAASSGCRARPSREWRGREPVRSLTGTAGRGEMSGSLAISGGRRPVYGARHTIRRRSWAPPPPKAVMFGGRVSVRRGRSVRRAHGVLLRPTKELRPPTARAKLVSIRGVGVNPPARRGFPKRMQTNVTLRGDPAAAGDGPTTIAEALGSRRLVASVT